MYIGVCASYGEKQAWDSCYVALSLISRLIDIYDKFASATPFFAGLGFVIASVFYIETKARQGAVHRRLAHLGDNEVEAANAYTENQNVLALNQLGFR